MTIARSADQRCVATSAAIGYTPGSYRTTLVTPVGAAPVAVSPHAGHFSVTSWYSVTRGGGGGAASKPTTPELPAMAGPCISYIEDGTE